MRFNLEREWRSNTIPHSIINMVNDMFYEDIYRTVKKCDKNGATIELELPGIGKGNIDVEAKTEFIVINWKSRDGESRKINYWIPTGYDGPNTKATYKDGLLTVTIPPDKSASHTVKVEVG